MNKTNELKKFRLDKEYGILEQAEMATNIIIERDLALSAYKYFIEYSAKVEQENPNTKNFRVYSNMRQNYRNDIDKHSQKAEQVRQEFRDKYGY